MIPRRLRRFGAIYEAELQYSSGYKFVNFIAGSLPARRNGKRNRGTLSKSGLIDLIAFPANFDRIDAAQAALEDFHELRRSALLRELLHGFARNVVVGVVNRFLLEMLRE